ncbi:brevican core protein-like [Ptychodera flava]|uniref:brevican core protein-like n=1 Tax=Ptychodera flava TaxID=63121 RepID=UPI00396A8E34
MAWIKFSVTLLCFMVVFSCAKSANDTVTQQAPKPGQCPKFGNATRKFCEDFCAYDADCSGDEKCCDNGCSFICHEPVSLNVNITKPGHCPPSSGAGGICVQECDGDGECEHSKKCCNNGCGHSCVEPDFVPPEKPGVCPSGADGGLCQANCTDDYSCPDRQKCCNNGCANVCLDPMPVVMTSLPPVYGDCPPTIKHVPSQCNNTCSKPEDCSHGEVCCYMECGYVCVDIHATIPVTPDTGECCDEGWTHHNTSCYKLVSVPEDFHLAGRECELLHQAHLADFHEKEEYFWALKFLEEQNDFKKQKPVWIGLQNTMTENSEWVWSDGALLTYDLWLDGQPDEINACGASQGLYGDAGFLNSPCREPQQFLCEYKLGGDTSKPTKTEKPDQPAAPIEDSMEYLHKLDNAIIAVIVIAVVVTVFGIGGVIVYCVKAKRSFVHQKLRRDDEMTIIESMDI